PKPLGAPSLATSPLGVGALAARSPLHAACERGRNSFEFVVHPLAGQGLNLGFGDLKALLDVVQAREPFRDLGDLMLLRRYERARSEPVAMMRLATDGLQRLFDPESEPALPALLAPLIGAREMGWRLVESFPWLKRRLVAHAAS
ncbi:MAG: hypothetical protein VW257_04040, partial [Quisquiliibacterium sp.]